MTEQMSLELNEKKYTKEEMREHIKELERVMKESDEPKLEIETIHHFAPGVYCREVRIPAGAVVVGKIHKTEHLNILSKGTLKVWTEDGEKLLTAPATIKSMPGTKRVGYAKTDCVWTTIHPTDETDLLKLEEMLIAPSYEELTAEEKQFLEEK